MKIICLVIDGFGIGAAPDAAAFGDSGANTYKTVSETGLLNIGNLIKLGLNNIDGVSEKKCSLPQGNFARLREVSAGKDTTTGHWELAGLVLDRPFPLFPNGFPEGLVRRIEEKCGVEFLGNIVASGTEIIEKLGSEHLKTGKPILYTSADSVFQIAAHTSAVPLERLYEICRISREELKGEFAVGRVIARPFTTVNGKFVRTEDRRDFSVKPFGPLVTDKLAAAGLRVAGVGKIEDIICFQGLTESYHTHANEEGLEKTAELAAEDFNGFVFVNLVETDSKYGHRNDAAGYAEALNKIDSALPGIADSLAEEDILIITADHGCDPKPPETDHTREYVPFIIYGKSLKKGVNLGTVNGFTCMSDTVLDFFALPHNGNSIKNKII